MELYHEQLKKRSRSLDYIPQIENVHAAAGSWVDPHDAQWSHQYYMTPITCKGRGLPKYLALLFVLRLSVNS